MNARLALMHLERSSCVLTFMHGFCFIIFTTMVSLLLFQRIRSVRLPSYKPVAQNFCTSFGSNVLPKAAWVLQFDGGSRGNPGLGGAGAVIYASDESNKLTEVWSGYFFLGKLVTNNEAEYTGLIEGLKQAVTMHIDSVAIQGDSELIVRQVLGIYQVRRPNLKPLHSRALRLLAKIPTKKLSHIPRAENARADELSNMAMDSLQTFSCYQKFTEYEALLKNASNFPPLDSLAKKPRKKRTPKAKPSVDVVLTFPGDTVQDSFLGVEAGAVAVAAAESGNKTEVNTVHGYGV